jgi:hypothetical protein
MDLGEKVSGKLLLFRDDVMSGRASDVPFGLTSAEHRALSEYLDVPDGEFLTQAYATDVYVKREKAAS